MYSPFMQSVGSFFLLAVAAITIQNTVFSRALNVSRLISLIDESTDTLIFGVLLSSVNIFSSALYYFANRVFLLRSVNAIYWRPFAMVICMSIAFFTIFVITVKFANYDILSKAVTALPVASINCTVISTLLISSVSNYPLGKMIAFGLGSSIGFVLAVLLVTEGQRKLQSRSTPAAFRGLPATLLFLAGLALAIYGLSGHSFSF